MRYFITISLLISSLLSAQSDDDRPSLDATHNDFISLDGIGPMSGVSESVRQAESQPHSTIDYQKMYDDEQDRKNSAAWDDYMRAMEDSAKIPKGDEELNINPFTELDNAIHQGGYTDPGSSTYHENYPEVIQEDNGLSATTIVLICIIVLVLVIVIMRSSSEKETFQNPESEFISEFSPAQRRAMLSVLVLIGQIKSRPHVEKNYYLKDTASLFNILFDNQMIVSASNKSLDTLIPILNPLKYEQKEWYVLIVHSLITLDIPCLDDSRIAAALKFFNEIGISKQQYLAIVDDSKTAMSNFTGLK
jgi:hypothetical protein